MIEIVKAWATVERDKYKAMWDALPPSAKTAVLVAVGVALFLGFVAA